MHTTTILAIFATTSLFPTSATAENPKKASKSPAKMEQVSTKPPPAWTSDWPLFVQEIGVQGTKDVKKSGNISAVDNGTNIAKTFFGKTVKFSGIVKSVNNASDQSKMNIEIVMTEKIADVAGHPFLTDKVTLKPDIKEALTWSGIAVGDNVTFRGALGKGFMTMGMSPAGQAFFWVSVDNAVKIIGQAGQSGPEHSTTVPDSNPK